MPCIMGMHQVNYNTVYLMYTDCHAWMNVNRIHSEGTWWRQPLFNCLLHPSDGNCSRHCSFQVVVSHQNKDANLTQIGIAQLNWPLSCASISSSLLTKAKKKVLCNSFHAMMGWVTAKEWDARIWQKGNIEVLLPRDRMALSRRQRCPFVGRQLRGRG